MTFARTYRDIFTIEIQMTTIICRGRLMTITGLFICRNRTGWRVCTCVVYIRSSRGWRCTILITSPQYTTVLELEFEPMIGPEMQWWLRQREKIRYEFNANVAEELGYHRGSMWGDITNENESRLIIRFNCSRTLKSHRLVSASSGSTKEDESHQMKRRSTRLAK